MLEVLDKGTGSFGNMATIVTESFKIEVRDALSIFFTAYNSTAIMDIDDIIALNRGRECELFLTLKRRYRVDHFQPFDDIVLRYGIASSVISNDNSSNILINNDSRTPPRRRFQMVPIPYRPASPLDERSPVVVANVHSVPTTLHQSHSVQQVNKTLLLDKQRELLYEYISQLRIEQDCNDLIGLLDEFKKMTSIIKQKLQTK